MASNGNTYMTYRASGCLGEFLEIFINYLGSSSSQISNMSILIRGSPQEPTYSDPLEGPLREAFDDVCIIEEVLKEDDYVISKHTVYQEQTDAEVEDIIEILNKKIHDLTNDIEECKQLIDRGNKTNDIEECKQLIDRGNKTKAKVQAMRDYMNVRRACNNMERDTRIATLNKRVAEYLAAHPDAKLDTTLSPQLLYRQFIAYREEQDLQESIRADKENRNAQNTTDTDTEQPTEPADSQVAPPPPTPQQEQSEPTTEPVEKALGFEVL